MKLNFSRQRLKVQRPKTGQGSLLVEAVVAMGLLSAVALVLFKGTMNVISPRQWTLSQNITDAYLTYEKAYAERIEFSEILTNNLTGINGGWPIYPAKNEFTDNLGTLPGGQVITGTIIRTRLPPDSGTLRTLADPNDPDSNPSELEIWKLQSHVLYTVAGREYVKSRTVVRTQ